MNTRTGRGWLLAIRGAAGLALLGILLLRGSQERAAADRSPARAVETPNRGPATFPELARTPELADQGVEAGRETPPVRPSAPETGAAIRPDDAGGAEFPGARVDRATLVRLHGDQPLDRHHPTVAKAIEIQERNTNWLMAHPAVVGTGVGLNEKGEIAITVLTKVAGASDLPGRIEGLPVVVWESGEIVARNRLAPQDAAATEDRVGERAKPSGPGSVSPKSRFPRPVPIGVSTSLPFSETTPYITAGTIGCRLTDVLTGATYALSNNHVYANENNATVGAAVLQPGTFDGGVDSDEIGNFSEFAPIVFDDATPNTIDAAIALCDTDELGAPLLGQATPAGGYGLPSSATAEASLSTPVLKYGRTTGQTSASISSINVTVRVGYDSGVALFENQVGIFKAGFSKGGDSGSLIVQSGDKKPVALLFAGSKTWTFGNPIDAVLANFGVTVDGQ